MNTVDIVLLIILVIGAIKGFRKGFVMEIVSIVALILAIFVGFKLLYEGISFLQDQFQLSGNFLPYLSFILLFIATILLVNVIGKAIKKVLDLTLLGGIDNIAGGILGLLKWGFGLSALLWIFNYFEINPLEKYVDGAVVYPFVVTIAPNVISFIASILPFSGDILDSAEKLV